MSITAVGTFPYLLRRDQCKACKLGSPCHALVVGSLLPSTKGAYPFFALLHPHSMDVMKHYINTYIRYTTTEYIYLGKFTISFLLQVPHLPPHNEESNRPAVSVH